MKRITSRHNTALRPYREAARRSLPDLILLDGAHLVFEALRAGVTIRHAVVRVDALQRDEASDLMSRLAERGIEVVAGSSSVMEAISPVRSPSAIVALAERPSAGDARLYRGSAPLVVVACDVQDPGNIGALVRVAEAGGATGVMVAGRSADPYGWKAIRGSMGSALRVPIAMRTRAADAVADARARGCRIVATAPRGGQLLFSADLRGSTAVLVGGEGLGLDRALLDTADARVTIPMRSPVESLNTAVSAALILYEAWRQRGWGSDLEC